MVTTTELYELLSQFQYTINHPSRQISHLSKKLKFRRHVHKGTTLVPILSYANKNNTQCFKTKLYYLNIKFCCYIRKNTMRIDCHCVNTYLAMRKKNQGIKGSISINHLQ